MAAFVDRDGVINDTVPDRLAGGRPESPYRPDDVNLADGAIDGLRRLQRLGLAVVVVSNQPAAAKGTATREALRAVHERVVELIKREGCVLDGWYYCFHHPEAVIPELSGECDCRKPQPGLLLNAARDLGLDLDESWMIGDSDTDIEAGGRVGCRTILVEHPGSVHRRRGQIQPMACATDLNSAAEIVDDWKLR